MRFLSIIGLVAGLSVTTFAQAANPEAGKEKAGGVCAGCHGANGLSVMPVAPNLAGQKEAYLVNALKAYKAKTRDASMMNQMASGLSDDDIANVAAYFSSLKACP